MRRLPDVRHCFTQVLLIFHSFPGYSDTQLWLVCGVTMLLIVVSKMSTVYMIICGSLDLFNIEMLHISGSRFRCFLEIEVHSGERIFDIIYCLEGIEELRAFECERTCNVGFRFVILEMPSCSTAVSSITVA